MTTNVTVVDFAVSAEGLSAQLLSTVVKAEAPELEGRMDSLLRARAAEESAARLQGGLKEFAVTSLLFIII